MPKHTPIRTCVATRAESAPEGLLRFVQGPKNEKGQTAPWPDISGKLPGRGVYLIPTAENYAIAIKKKVFAHQLDTNQPPPPFAEVAALLEKDALQRLGLAKKAGQLVLGLDNVLEEGRKSTLKALILAADAGADARNKVEALSRRLELPLLMPFGKAALEQALGQPNLTVIGFTRLDTAWPAVHKAQHAKQGNGTDVQ